MRGYHLGGPYNEDCTFFGWMMGSPYFGKLPHRCMGFRVYGLETEIMKNTIEEKMETTKWGSGG